MKSTKKSKYTRNQQSAYHSGRGYAVAHAGKKIEFSSSDMKESFMAGYKAGRDAMKKSPKKYPENPNLKRR